MKRLKNIIGKKFNRLTAIKFIGYDEKNRTIWLFKCDCGQIKNIQKTKVICSRVKSCGCLEKEYKFKPKHCLSKKHRPTYSSWINMLARCNNNKNKNYKNYGGRGIKVCNRWLNSFENFFYDMGEKPKNKTLDRINNDGDYEPNNCRWATASEQISNTRKVIKIQFNGETKIAKEWAKLYCLNYWNFLYYYKKTKDIKFSLIKAKKLINNPSLGKDECVKRRV